MNVEAIRKELGLSPSDFARKLGVSPGHAADLRSTRRRPTLKIARKLEEMTGRTGLVDALVAEKTGEA